MTPRPGHPARGTRTGRPTMVVLDVLGRRWTLRILWELRGPPLSFRALRRACDDLSPTVLNRRLAELRELALVESTADGYQLTTQGRSLGRILLRLDGWAKQWARRLPSAARSDAEDR